MSDGATLVLALATAGGAWAAWPVPLPLAVVLPLVALVLRHAALLIVAAALLAAALSARAWAGLHPPATGPFRGTVTLVGDPVSDDFGLRVDARVRGKRVEVRAGRAVAPGLDRLLAGERVEVTGRLGPVGGPERKWLAPRHVGGRLVVDQVGEARPGAGLARLTNRVHRALMAGAAALPPQQRPLFGGFVLGDDRGQRAEVAEDFRSSGLTHLLVVSGENVAFVLALAAPALGRLGPASRLVVGGCILVAFGTLVRWEPSVVRAVAMAALALVATAAARPSSRLRILALAVTGVVLVDPLLIGSVGFQMSVGASAAIVVLAAPMARALPGPRGLALALGATIAAQIGVAPVAVPRFGGLPVASLPANLLALPVAGALMMWGLGAGLPAGLIGGVASRLLHLPTRMMVAWIAGVARVCGGVPLGRLESAHLLALVALGVAMALAARRWCRRVLIVLAAVVLLSPALSLARPRAVDGDAFGRGVAVWRAGRVVVVTTDRARVDGARALAAARRAGVRHVDLLVVGVVTSATAGALAPLLRRVHVRTVLAPPGGGPPAWHRVTAPAELLVGPFQVQLRPTGDRLAATVGRIPSRQ